MLTVKVEFTLFHTFTVRIDGMDVTPTGMIREFLALMVASGREGVSAESYWRLVYKDNKLPFNGALFTRAYAGVMSFLKRHHAEGIIKYSLHPMRSCRIDCDRVSCDYYRMQKGETGFGKREDFLPEFKWALKVFRGSGWEKEVGQEKR